MITIGLDCGSAKWINNGMCLYRYLLASLTFQSEKLYFWNSVYRIFLEGEFYRSVMRKKISSNILNIFQPWDNMIYNNHRPFNMVWLVSLNLKLPYFVYVI